MYLALLLIGAREESEFINMKFTFFVIFKIFLRCTERKRDFKYFVAIRLKIINIPTVVVKYFKIDVPRQKRIFEKILIF